MILRATMAAIAGRSVHRSPINPPLFLASANGALRAWPWARAAVIALILTVGWADTHELPRSACARPHVLAGRQAGADRSKPGACELSGTCSIAGFGVARRRLFALPRTRAVLGSAGRQTSTRRVGSSARHRRASRWHGPVTQILDRARLPARFDPRSGSWPLVAARRCVPRACAGSAQRTCLPHACA